MAFIFYVLRYTQPEQKETKLSRMFLNLEDRLLDFTIPVLPFKIKRCAPLQNNTPVTNTEIKELSEKERDRGPGSSLLGEEKREYKHHMEILGINT